MSGYFGREGTKRLALLLFFLLFLSGCATPVTPPPSSLPTATVLMPTVAIDYSLIPRATYGALDPVPTVTPGGATTVSFATDIQPIFLQNCVRCHGGIAGMWLTDYEHVVAGSINGEQVFPGDARRSPLLRYVEAGLMPPDTDPLFPDQIDLIRRWIDEGALNN